MNSYKKRLSPLSSAEDVFGVNFYYEDLPLHYDNYP